MDDSLIKARLKRRDKKTFDSIFTYYYSGLCTYAYKYIKDRARVEDIVQDFFVCFWANCTDLEVSGPLKSYFFGAVKNRCLDEIKHDSVKSRYKDQVINLSSENDGENCYAEAELLEIIEKTIAKLQPRTRDIFTMSRIQGQSNKEISALLGISKRTVEIQISKALKELKKYLPG